MIIYIDNDFKCHITNSGSMTSIEDAFFNNKCPNLIESYRFVPSGETWTREDGIAFVGLMIAPWRDIRQYDGEQRAYERNLITQYEAALSAIEQALEVQT